MRGHPPSEPAADYNAIDFGFTQRRSTHRDVDEHKCRRNLLPLSDFRCMSEGTSWAEEEKRTYYIRHKLALLFNVLRYRLLVDPVEISFRWDRAYSAMRENYQSRNPPRHQKVTKLRDCVPGPEGLPLTKDRESKNHMISAGTEEALVAYTGTPATQ